MLSALCSPSSLRTIAAWGGGDGGVRGERRGWRACPALALLTADGRSAISIFEYEQARRSAAKLPSRDGAAG